MRSRAWMETSELKDEAEDGDHLAVLNFLLDVPPPLTYIPHTVPVQVSHDCSAEGASRYDV